MTDPASEQRSGPGVEFPTTWSFHDRERQGGERPGSPQSVTGCVPLTVAFWANPFVAGAVEAADEPGSPHPGSGRPAARGGLGNGRSGQTGFRSWARNPRGLAGIGGGGLSPASGVGKAALGCFVFHPRRRPCRMGVGGTADVWLGNPVSGMNQQSGSSPTPLVSSSLLPGPDFSQEYLED